MTRGLRELDVSRNDCLENLLAEVLVYLFGNLLRECRSTVIHRQENSEDVEIGIHAILDHLHRLKQLGNTFQGVELALNRYQQAICCHKRVHRQQAE